MKLSFSIWPKGTPLHLLLVGWSCWPALFEFIGCAFICFMLIRLILLRKDKYKTALYILTAFYLGESISVLLFQSQQRLQLREIFVGTLCLF